MCMCLIRASLIIQVISTSVYLKKKTLIYFVHVTWSRSLSSNPKAKFQTVTWDLQNLFFCCSWLHRKNIGLYDILCHCQFCQFIAVVSRVPVLWVREKQKSNATLKWRQFIALRVALKNSKPPFWQALSNSYCGACDRCFIFAARRYTNCDL